jgi:hypothetical protein
LLDKQDINLAKRIRELDCQCKNGNSTTQRREKLLDRKDINVAKRPNVTVSAKMGKILSEEGRKDGHETYIEFVRQTRY